MAAKTFYLTDSSSSGFGTLSETDPGASTMGTGWVVAKVGSGNFSAQLYGTERASGTFSTTDYLVTTHPNPTTGDSWRSANTINGSFANANWVLTFAVRAVTAASAQRGRIKLRVWRSVNADGSSATELTSATQTGGIIAGISTSADNTTAVTWAPGGILTLTNEYLLVQCEWEITTASGSNSGDIDFRASASTVVTSTFTPATQALTAGLFTNTNVFNAPKIVRTLGPALFTNTSTFYAPKIVRTLKPGLFTNSSTFYAPTVTPGARALTASLFTNSSTFYSPTVGRGAITLTASLFTDSDVFYSPTVTPGVKTLTASLFTDSDVFYSPTVSPGARALTAALFTNASTFYAPRMGRGLAPALFTDADVFYSPTVSTGGETQELAPSLFTNDDTFYAPTVVAFQPDQAIEVPLYTNESVFYGPAAHYWTNVDPAVPATWAVDPPAGDATWQDPSSPADPAWEEQPPAVLPIWHTAA